MRPALAAFVASALALFSALRSSANQASPTFYVAPHVMVAQQGDEFTLLTDRPGAIIAWQTVPADAARVDSRGRVTVLTGEGRFFVIGSIGSGFDAALVVVKKRSPYEPILTQIRKKKQAANVLKNQQVAIDHRRMEDDFKIQHLRTFLHDLAVTIGSPSGQSTRDAIVARLEELVRRYADFADVLKDLERSWRDEGAVLDSLDEVQKETDALLVSYQIALAHGPQTSPGIPISTDYEQIYRDIVSLISRLKARGEKLKRLAEEGAVSPAWDRDAESLKSEAEAMRGQVAASSDPSLADVRAMIARHDALLSKVSLDATHLFETAPPFDAKTIKDKLDAVARVRASLAPAASIASAYALYQRAWENRSLVAFQPMICGAPAPNVAKELGALANVATADLATREWKVLAAQYQLGMDDLSLPPGAAELSCGALLPIEVGFALATRGNGVWRKSFDDLVMQPGGLTPAEYDFVGVMRALLETARNSGK